MKLPALNLPRKYSRLPRVGRITNPFKDGTSKTTKRVKRALAAHTAALAANQVPGKAVAAGALGHVAAGPSGAAAGFGAVEAASVAASALLARSLARRGKAASYLSRRSKRKTGIYKGKHMTDTVDALYDAIEKARSPFAMGSRKLATRLERKRERLNRYVQHVPPAHKGLPYNRAVVKPGKEAQAAKLDRAIAAINTRTPRSFKTTPRFAGGRKRVGVYKAVDELGNAIEKAKHFRGERVGSAARRKLANVGNVFRGEGPAGRVSDKDSKSVARRLKRAGAGVNAAALKRSLKLRAKRTAR